MEGGPAEKDGKLKIGDHVISVSENLHFMVLLPLTLFFTFFLLFN